MTRQYSFHTLLLFASSWFDCCICKIYSTEEQYSTSIACLPA